MIKVKLTQGAYAIVDAEDFDRVSVLPWGLSKSKYGHRYAMVSNFNLERISMHRLIMGAKKGDIVDHINGNGLDNRRSNLRFCTQTQNQQNRKISVGGTSEYKGVHLQGKKYKSALRVNGKDISLGVFENEKAAAMAYDLAAIKYFGEFAKLNFPSLRNRSAIDINSHTDHQLGTSL